MSQFNTKTVLKHFVKWIHSSYFGLLIVLKFEKKINDQNTNEKKMNLKNGQEELFLNR